LDDLCVCSPPDSKVVLEFIFNLCHFGAEFVDVVVRCFHVVVEVDEGLNGVVGSVGLADSILLVGVHLLLGKFGELREVPGVHVMLGAYGIENRVELGFLKSDSGSLDSNKRTAERFHVQ
jgi:hypothetical protein